MSKVKAHKHAEVIKAWADGAEIEYQSVDGSWFEASTPSWSIKTEYRVKPKPKPNVHHELIKQWEKGAVIQFRSFTGKWVDTESNEPAWYDSVQYRVKPVPKPDYSKFVGLYKSGQFHDTSGVYNSKSYVPKNHAEDDDFVITNKLELVFDGETEQLKNIVIHNKD